MAEAIPTEPKIGAKEVLEKRRAYIDEFNERIRGVKKTGVDATTILFSVWVMYKLNIITRIQVKDFLQIIKEGKWPEDVVKYLQDEVKKI